MSGQLFWTALALLLIVEGLIPFISPQGWRRTVTQIARLRDGQIRFIGLGGVAVGLLLLWLVD